MVKQNFSKESNRIKWIDAVKFISIVAVLIDHSYMILYTNSNINILSYFSVSVFIITSGYTSFNSLLKHKDRPLKSELFRKIKTILIPYTIATAFSTFVYYNFFDFEIFLRALLEFNSTGPMYFVGLYLQLIIISPLFFGIIQIINRSKYKMILHISILAFLLMISLLTTNYTLILSKSAVPVYLFGGTYICLYYIGMILPNLNMTRYQSLKPIFLIISVLCLVFFSTFICNDRFAIDAYFPFGEGKNPPGISLFLYSFACFSVISLLFSILENSNVKFVKSLVSIFSHLGRHSLFIFLYHFPILILLQRYSMIENMSLKRIMYFSSMILVPITINSIYNLLKTSIAKILSYDI